MINEKEFMKIFSKNLKMYMEKYSLTQAELAKRVEASPSTVSSWVVGVRVPRMSKIDKLCEIFHCRRSDLMYDHSDDETYYVDSEAREMAEFLFTNPEYRVLFSAVRSVKKEDIEFVKNLIDRVKE